MAEPAREVVLRAEAVTAGYGGPPIIEDVSIAVLAGKITAIRTLGGHRRFRASEINRCLREMEEMGA